MLPLTYGGPNLSILSSHQDSGASNQTGTAYTVKPAQGTTPAVWETASVRFGCRVKGNGGTAGTITVQVQGSQDGVVWYALATSTAFAADNSNKGEVIADVNGAVMPMQVRAISTLGGTANPTYSWVDVWVLSNVEFVLAAA